MSYVKKVLWPGEWTLFASAGFFFPLGGLGCIKSRLLVAPVICRTRHRRLQRLHS